MSLVKSKVENSIQEVLSDYLTAENLFCCAYILLLLSEAVAQTMFDTPSSFFTLCKLLAMALIGVKILLYDRFNLTQMIVCGLLVVECFFIMRRAGYTAPIYFVLPLIGAKDVDFRKILKIYLTVVGSVVLIAFIGSLIGVVVNLRYEPLGNTWHNTRNAFGIIYPTDFAAFIFFLLLAFFYLKGSDLKYYHYIGALILDALVFYFCETRLDCICIALMVIVFAIVNKINKEHVGLKDKYRNKRDWIAILSPFFMPICIVCIFVLTLAYNPSNSTFDKLNDLLSHRLSIAQTGMEEYGITPFGTSFLMFGNGGTTNQTAEYFFLDSSYFYTLLQFGLIFFLTITAIFMYCCWKNRKDHFYAAAILLLSINCMIAHHMTSMAYDPFILAFLASMNGERVALPRFSLSIRKKKEDKVTTGPSIKLNFIMDSILTVSGLLFPIITYPYVSRVLGPEAIGRVAFATSTVSFFAIFAQLGIPTYAVQQCSAVRDDKKKLSLTYSEIISLNLITCAVTYVVFFAAVLFVSRFAEMKLLLFITGAAILLDTLSIQWFYQGLEKYSYITICSLILRVLSIVGIFLFIHSPEDYYIYALLPILTSLVFAVLNQINSRRYVSFVNPHEMHVFQHLRPVLVFFGMAVSTTVYTHLDTVMLGFMTSDLDVGFYSTAIKFKTLLTGVIMSLGTVLLPRTSYYLNKGMKEEASSLSRRGLHFNLLLSLPLCLYFMLFARECILFIAGNQYTNAILPMIILMPTLVLIAMTNIMGMQMLVPSGRAKIVLYSTITGAVVDVVVNILLIPRFASVGAAIGTLAAEISVLIFQFNVLIKSDREVFSSFRLSSCIPVVIALIAGTVCSLGVKFMNTYTFIILVISAVIFFGVYGIVLLLFKEPLTIEAITLIKGRINSYINLNK